MEPFPTSVIKGYRIGEEDWWLLPGPEEQDNSHLTPFIKDPLIWLFTTTTKICTKGCSSDPHGRKPSQKPPCRSTRQPLLLTSEEVICLSCRLSIGRTLSAIHFQDWFIRPVSCYTLLRWFLLPWPHSGCLHESIPFLVSGISVRLAP